MSAAPLPICEKDGFCCSPPGHDGACDQPFETEYPIGAFEQVAFVRKEFMRRAFEQADADRVKFARMLHESGKQGGLF